MSIACCCLPGGISEHVECNVEETKDGLALHLRGKTDAQTEALKTFYSSWKTLRGDKSESDCGCCC